MPHSSNRAAAWLLAPNSSLGIFLFSVTFFGALLQWIQTCNWAPDFFFQPSHVACRILVPQQEIEARPPQSKCQVLTQSLLKFLSIESVMLPSHLILNKCELFLPPRISSSMLNSLNFLCKSRYPLLHCCCLSLAPWALVEVSWLIEAGGCYRLWGGSLLVKLTIPWCSSWVRSLSLFQPLEYL